jgi:hypothetical protein
LDFPEIDAFIFEPLLNHWLLWLEMGRFLILIFKNLRQLIERELGGFLVGRLLWQLRLPRDPIQNGNIKVELPDLVVKQVLALVGFLFIGQHNI